LFDRARLYEMIGRTADLEGGIGRQWHLVPRLEGVEIGRKCVHSQNLITEKATRS
jgi:hypothetical protein